MKMYAFNDGSVREHAFAMDKEELYRVIRDGAGYDVDDSGYMEQWREMDPNETLSVTLDEPGRPVETRSVSEWIEHSGQQSYIFTSTEW